MYYYGARYYDGKEGVWLSVDPLAEKYPGFSLYNYTGDHPINIDDPDGMDWYDIDGNIQWKDQEGDLKIGDNTYKSLGKNVLVGTHNRDASGNEPINTAKFELYLESNKEGPSAPLWVILFLLILQNTERLLKDYTPLSLAQELAMLRRERRIWPS